MKSFTFTLLDDEAASLQSSISMLQYSYPDISAEDALVAIVLRGADDIGRRLEKLAAWKRS